MLTRTSKLSIFVGIVLATLLSSPAAAEQAAPTAPTATTMTESQAQAHDLLEGMARFIGGQDRFSVRVRASYDVVQADGRKVEFGDQRTVTLRRPDRLRVDIQTSDGEKTAVYYDGATLTTYNVPHNVYAQAPTAKTLDEAVAYFIRGLRMRMPLAVLIVNDIAGEIERRMTEVDYVEYSTMCPTPCHHLAGRTDSTDVQVWIAAGKEPVPLRVVITYRDAVGQPQYHAELSDWNFAPKADDAVFAFVPPRNAQKIPYAVDLTPLAEAAGDAGGKTGEQP